MSKKRKRAAQMAGTQSRHKHVPNAARRGDDRAKLPHSLAEGAIAFMLAASVAVVYAQVATFDFISLDDPQYVINNPYVAAGLTWPGVRWALTAHYAANWHPLTWMSHMLDVELFGMNAGSHHLMNVIIHAASAIVLFLALSRMTGSRGPSAFVAALFALHPLHVESVAWVAERKDVLSTFFWMLTIYAYVRHVRSPGSTRYAVVLVSFTLGLMSKPMVITLPFVLLLLDFWPLARLDRQSVTHLSAWVPLVREKLPMFLLVIGSAVITIIAQRGGGAVIALQSLPLTTRVGNALVTYVEYIRDMLLPVRLAVFYPFVEYTLASALAAALCIAVVSVVVVRLARRAPYLPVGWAWYLGTMIPVIGIVQAGAQARADRYTYVPLIGLFIMITWGGMDIVKRFRRGRPALVWVAAAIVAVCAFAAHRQTRYWKDSLSLWGRTVAVTRDNYRAEDHYGVALTDRGRLAEGIEHYLAALRIWPGYPAAHNNLGTARIEQGRIDDAIHEFSAAARLQPGNATFHYNLGVAHSMKADTAGAIAHIREAKRLDPESAQYSEALRILGDSEPAK